MLELIKKEIVKAKTWFDDGDNVWGYALDEVEKHLIVAHNLLLDYSKSKGFDIDEAIVFKKTFTRGSIDLTMRERNLYGRALINLLARLDKLFESEDQLTYNHVLRASNTFVKLYEDI